MMCSLSPCVYGAQFENDVAEAILSGKTQVIADEISKCKTPMISMTSNKLLDDDGTENKEDENCHKIECKKKRKVFYPASLAKMLVNRKHLLTTEPQRELGAFQRCILHIAAKLRCIASVKERRM